MNKRSLLGIIFMIALLLSAVPQAASAEPNITIESEAGFDGKAKYGKGLPVLFTITNNGPDFSGDLLMATAEGYNLNHTVAIPVSLAQGETKTIQVASNGGIDLSYSYSGSTESLELYEGGWEDGKKVKFNGKKNLQAQYHEPDAFFIATLTNNADRLNALSQTSVVGRGQVELFHLNQLEDFILPAEPTSWQSIDALVIDEVAFSDLSPAIQSAIFEWVRQGGQMLVGSTGTLNAEMGEYASELPLTLGQQARAQVTGLGSDIPVFEATAVEGADVLLQNEGQVLAASKKFGAGEIIQTAFSLGDEGISDQDAYPQVMQMLIGINPVATMWVGESIKSYLGSELSNVNELFDSFNVSQPVMLLIIILYIVIVVPVLYIFLKRRDKREYAWFVIPAIAVLVSLAIFGYGAKDRITNPQVQQIGFFEADQDGGLKGYYMNSVLSNRAGDYSFTAPVGTTMTHYTNYGGFGESGNSSIVEQEGGKSKLTIRDMRNWSVSSIIGDAYIQDAGNLAVDLRLEDELLSGPIRNNFPFALEDVSIWTGTRLIELGDLAPGEELSVEETMQSGFLAPAFPITSQGNYYSIKSIADLHEERRYMVQDMTSEMIASGSDSPMIVGYAKDGLVPAVLEGDRASVEALYMIAQKFDPAGSISGEVSIGRDGLIMTIDTIGNGFYENYSNNPYMYYFETGDYELTYTLPGSLASASIEWSDLTVAASTNQMELTIFNQVSGEFEVIDDRKKSFGEAASSYIDENDAIRLGLKVPNTAAGEFTVPQIDLKGVVKE
ncbi:hypothetical protein [Planomicrobium sp. YIM 101495]|uniref:hypothetical protein n=1 Tax=Planomicrobium sp. YIM 101495 TaxID=2665160 RepID=UPI0012BA34A0|nr:hypothetical protein [Planomicrobium sp. YIM 101495]MTD30403.1 hypothetical protein [Planomicrobium sp. YIM 101495]